VGNNILPTPASLLYIHQKKKKKKKKKTKKIKKQKKKKKKKKTNLPLHQFSTALAPK